MRLSLPVSSRCVQRLHPLQSTPCSRQPALPITPKACSPLLHAVGLQFKRRLYSGPSGIEQPSAVADSRESQISSATATDPNGANGQLHNGHTVAANAPGTAEPGSTATEPEYILFTAADLAATGQESSSSGDPPAAAAAVDGTTAVTIQPVATVDAAEQQQQQQQGHQHPLLAAEAGLASPAAAVAVAAAKDLAVRVQPNRGQEITDQQQQQQQQTAAAAVPNAEQDSTATAAATDTGDNEQIFPPGVKLEPLKTQDINPSSDQLQQQQQQVPPPLIDPDVDILNDPSFAIRLMDILDQISSSAAPSSLQSTKGPFGTAAAAGTTQQQQQQQQRPNRHYNFIRQPAPFCTNCCTPLDPYRPAAPCSSCGHLAANDTLLLNLGVASDADLARYPAWQQQQQPPDSASSASSGGSFVLDTQQLAQRLEAGVALKHAKQLLRDAGILDLNTTVLAYEDDLVDQEPAMMLHRGMLPPNHERPERLKVILARLRTAGLLDVCDRLPPREATDEELLAVHSPGMIAAISALSHANSPSDLNQVAAHLSPDTLGNRYTYRAARLAAGTAAEMARQIVTGAVSNGMALIRPMGHNAGINSTDGGNYFNNVAVAARAAQAAGAKRIMIIDWDIHHGKGTSEIFAEDPNVLVFSLHRYGSDFYPGSGPADDVGIGRGKGRNINVAWCPPSVVDRKGRRVEVDGPPISDGDYLSAFHVLVLPVLTEFKPDLVLVSAGFDAVDKDPLGYYRVHPECFAQLTALLLPLAPVGMLLEGGYNLSATAASVEACVRVLLGEPPPPLPGSRVAGVTGWSSILRTLLVHQQHWQSLSMMNFLELANPIAVEEQWEDDREDYSEEVFEAPGEEEEEYELQEGEFSEALGAAAATEQATPAAAAEEEDDTSEAAETSDSAEDSLKRIMEILDQRIAAEEQIEDFQQHEEERLQMIETVGEGEAADATSITTSSSSGSSGWSAGGFLDDPNTVDSGSDSADDSTSWVNPSSRTDWGLEQYDEDVTEHLEWYGGKEAQKQLRRAEKAAAEATAAIEGEVVAAVAAERGVQAAGHVGAAPAVAAIGGGGGGGVSNGAVESVGGTSVTSRGGGSQQAGRVDTAAAEAVAVAAGGGGSGVGGSAVESVGGTTVSSRGGGSEQAAVAASAKSADDASS